ncbi:MAG TPA: hypothetical protein VMT86_11360 [Bryobacteraceae bacterium]|nr:hypothetical protein [Bryobacteraceae bacterium]
MRCGHSLVTSNQRAGIAGANGTGRPALLKVLAGLDGLDHGTMTVTQGAVSGSSACHV